MTYEVTWDAYFVGTSQGVTTALNTVMSSPTVGIRTGSPAGTAYRKTYTNTMYLKTALGVKITTTGKFHTFSIYIADPACDNPVVVAPTTVSKSFTHLIAAADATIWTITGSNLYTATQGIGIIKTCPLGFSLDTSGLS